MTGWISYFFVNVLADAVLVAAGYAVLWWSVRRKTAALDELAMKRARLEMKLVVSTALDVRGRRPGNEEYLKLIFTTLSGDVLADRLLTSDDVELRKQVEEVVRLRITRGLTELGKKVGATFVKCFCSSLARAVVEGKEADDKTAASLTQLFDEFVRGELKSPEKIVDN